MRRRLGAVLLCFLFAVGCATTKGEGQKKVNATAAGAIIGAAVGGVAGAATGPKKNKGRRMLIGAIAGAVVGGAIGYILDQQAEELAENLGVEPVDNTNPEVKLSAPPISQDKPSAVVKDPEKLRLVFKESVLFDKDGYELKPSGKETIKKVAKTLRQRSDTVFVVAGFTDSAGGFNHGVELSERRARAVKNELVLNGIDPTRVLVFGCGPKKPIAPNDSPEARALNRRVEVLVYPPGATIPHPCE
jgi:outer membrane protein OmpA-like peptidoglycan-associated protein